MSRRGQVKGQHWPIRLIFQPPHALRNIVRPSRSAVGYVFCTGHSHPWTETFAQQKQFVGACIYSCALSEQSQKTPPSEASQPSTCFPAVCYLRENPSASATAIDPPLRVIYW